MELGRKIPLHNNGTPVRNWLHAKDTADGIITIINSGVKNEIFNIAGGFEQSNIVTIEKIINEFQIHSSRGGKKTTGLLIKQPFTSFTLVLRLIVWVSRPLAIKG